MWLEKETYYKTKIDELKDERRRARDELDLMTKINVMIKKDFAPLEELYYKVDKKYRRTDASTKDIIYWSARLIKRYLAGKPVKTGKIDE